MLDNDVYMVFEITFSTGKVGYITIVDTAGRESPMEIYNLFINHELCTKQLVESMDHKRK
jgi:hypothetical protein